MSVTPSRIAFSKLPSLPSFRPFDKGKSAARSTGLLRLGDSTSHIVLIIHNDLLCNGNTIISSLTAQDIEHKTIYAFHDNAFKSLYPLTYDAIIILGAKTDILYEQPKWLKKEMEFMTKALKLNVPILGICLGCLLLAKCIGGTVSKGKNGPEIGYKNWTYFHCKTETETEESDSDSDSDAKEETLNSFKPLTFQPFTIYDSDNNKTNQLKYIGKSKSTPFVLKSLNLNVNSTHQFTDYQSNDFNEDDFEESDCDFIEDDIVADLDPFMDVLACENMDKYIILWNNKEIKLPLQCSVSAQEIKTLAKTDKYNNTLFRVGQYSYGFMALPQLNSDMLNVWCKCWSQSFFDGWNGNLEKDVIEYAKANDNQIKCVGKDIFDVWCNEIVLIKKKVKLFEE